MKWPHTFNNNPTERFFKRGYGRKCSYTNVLIRFPHNSADASRSTVLGYVSSSIRPVEKGQYPIGCFPWHPSVQSLTNHGPGSQLLSCILPLPLSGRSLYIHLTQSHLAVAIFSSMLSLSWNSKHYHSLLPLRGTR